MKRILVLIILLGIAQSAFGDEMLVYKYAEGEDKYATFISPSSQNVQMQLPSHAIARKLQGAKFLLDFVSTEFYDIKVTNDIVFFGERLTQYEITPLSNDRFAHNVWVDSEGRLIKTEIFDSNKKLMFAFGTFDIDKGKKSQKLKLDKQEKKLAKNFYKGFRHASTKMMPDGVVHMVFMDGLNRFSVFINPFPENESEVKKIIYGNYLCSKTLSGVEYTIMGSLPYKEMDNIIEIFAGFKQQMIESVEKGSVITEDIYKINDTNGGTP